MGCMNVVGAFYDCLYLRLIIGGIIEDCIPSDADDNDEALHTWIEHVALSIVSIAQNSTILAASSF